MTLRQKQSYFVRLIGRLINQASLMGYELTWGQALRSAEEAERLAAAGKGIRNSLHCVGLAVDFNLFDRNGVYLATTEAWEPLGEWWEKQGTQEVTCCWGGRFKDGNHFSVEHEGRK